MFDFNKHFISFGIEYDSETFDAVRNKLVYSDYNLPPTKPRKGGFWASEYREGGLYLSNWHEFMVENLCQKMFREKIDGRSTVFKLKPQSKVFSMTNYTDIRLELPNGYRESEECIPVHHVKVGSEIDPLCAKKMYINHEKVAERFDALYISQDLVQGLQYELAKFDSKLISGQLSKEEELQYAEFVCKAQLFEDWHVDTLLIYNKECLEILKTEENRKLKL